MKHLILVTFISLSLNFFAQVSKTINVLTPGTLSTLFTANEKNTVTNLSVSGSIDARDFRFLRDSIKVLTYLDLKTSTISAYSGIDGSYWYQTDYRANSLPQYAFSRNFTLTTIILPTTIDSIQESALFYMPKLTTIELPSTLKYIGPNAFKVCSALTNIILPDSLITISNNAFERCTALSIINFPNSVKTIENSAFIETGLTGIVIPNSVKNIKDNSFGGCTKLTSITLPADLDSIGNGAFSSCSSLTTITFPPSIKYIGKWGFNYCTALDNIVIPENISIINESSFSNCQSLTNITIPNSVTTIDKGAFQNCLKLTNIVIPESVSIIGQYAFRNTAITSFTFPKLVNKIDDNTFYGCKELTKINIPSSIIELGEDAFANCTGLIDVTIPSSVKTLGSSAFQNCTGIKSIETGSPFPIKIDIYHSVFTSIVKSAIKLTVPYSSKNLYAIAEEWKDFGDIVENPKGLFPKNDTITIGAPANSKSTVSFISNTTWSVSSDESWLRIDKTSGSGSDSIVLTAESNPYLISRKAIITFILRDALAQVITVIQEPGTKYLSIIAGDLSTVMTETERTTTTKLAISGTIDARDFKYIRDNMPIIAHLDISNAQIVEYNGNQGTTADAEFQANTIPQHAFSAGNWVTGTAVPKTSLKTIQLPETLKSIGYSAFYRCTGLKNIELPDGVETIDNSAFNECSELTRISLPKSLKSINYDAFRYCVKLNNVTLPDSLTKLDGGAFCYCSSLTEINIPFSVKTINESAFVQCTSITKISSALTTPLNLKSPLSVFYGIDKKKCIMYVPYKTKSKYQNSAGWKDFVNTIELSTGLLLDKEKVVLAETEGATDTVKVDSNTSWSVRTNDFWVKIDIITGSGIKITANENPLIIERTAKIYIDILGAESQSIEVVQQAGIKNINTTSGQLSTKISTDEQAIISRLSVVGSMDARDFKYIRGSLLNLAYLDLSKVTITAYTGSDGTSSSTNPVSYPELTIPEFAFYQDINNRNIILKKLILPENAEMIDVLAVSNYTELSEISIPSHIQKFGERCFENTNKISKIEMNRSVPLVNNTITNFLSAIDKSTTTLKVPYLSKSRYKTADTWKEFVNIDENENGCWIEFDSVCISESNNNEAIILLKANVNWSISNNQSWLKVTNGNGSSNGEIRLSGEPNIKIENRYADLIVTSEGFQSQRIRVMQKGISKTILTKPGQLINQIPVSERKTLSRLVVIGKIDARDFKFMRDSLPQLEELNLEKDTIVQYTGFEAGYTGTDPERWGYTTYYAATVPANAFYNKKNLRYVALPVLTKSLEKNAFNGCLQLTNFSIPDSVTTLGSRAFYACSSLKSIKITPKIVSIGTSCFSYCVKLDTVTVSLPIPIVLQVTSYLFSDIDKTNCVLQVPKGSKVLYQDAIEWKDFKNILEYENGFQLSTNILTFDALNVQNKEVSIKTDLTWTASSNQSWLTLNKTTGAGDNAIIITAQPNLTFGYRKAVVTFRAKENIQIITVSQDPSVKTVTIVAGGLNSAIPTSEQSTLSKLIIKGTMDARDFKTIRNKLILLTSLNISETTIEEYTGTEGTYSTASTIYPAATIPAYALFQNYYYNESLKEITLPASISTIGQRAFTSCRSLNNINIPNTVTTIGDYAFYDCTSLKNIVLSENLQAIPNGCFTESGITSIILPSSVNFIGSFAFNACKNLTNATLSNSITTIADNAFNDCSALSEIKLPESLINIGASCFTNCTKLTEVNIPNNIKLIDDYLFSNCTSLRNITLSNSLKHIYGYAFLNCSLLTEVQLPQTLNSIGYGAFQACTSLDNIIIPDSTTLIGTNAFLNCSALKNITIGSLVKTIETNGFGNCIALENIYVRADLPPITDQYQSAKMFSNVNLSTCELHVPYGSLQLYETAYEWKDFRGIIENKNGFILQATTGKIEYNNGSKLGIGVKSDGIYTVLSNQNWLTVENPTLFGNDSIQLVALQNQSNLTRKAIVTVSANGVPSKTINITQLGWPKTVNINAGDLQTSIPENEISEIIDLTITGKIDARDFKIIREKMPQLVNLNISGSSIIAYTGNDGTSSVDGTTYPANTIPEYAFYSSSRNSSSYKLTKIIFPETVTAIGNFAFRSCISVNNINLPAKLTTIGSSSFQSCNHLVRITLGDSLRSIGSYAFQYCIALEKIALPEKLGSIGINCFEGCTGLKSIFANNPLPITITYYVFSNVDKQRCILNVAYGKKSLYAAKEYWSDFQNIDDTHGLTLSENIIGLTSNDGTADISVTSNDPWQVKSQDSWLKTSISECSGSGIFSIAADDNLTNYSRVGKLIVSSSFEGIPDKTITITQEGAPKSIQLTAGNLINSLTPEELKTLKGLAISGTIDARDFKTMRNLMPQLTYIDIENSTILQYTGTEGTEDITSVTYPANTIPQFAFWVNNTEVRNYSLKKIIFPSNLVSVGMRSFIYCAALDNLILPNTVTSVERSAFFFCSALKKLTLSNSLKNIGRTAFYYCDKLTNFKMPETVVSIGDFAFQYCWGIHSLEIPATVTSIGQEAFANCSNLSSISVFSRSPQSMSLLTNVFNFVNRGTCTLYVPNGTKSLYQAASQWKDFLTIAEMNTGFEDNNQFGIYLYSVPSARGFMIKGLNEPSHISVFDINGKKIFERSIEIDELIKMEKFPKSIYLIIVETKNLTTIHKLINY